MGNTLFNYRLKEAMKLRNMTQHKLCEKTKIPKSAMSQYVNGRIIPKTDRLGDIAKALSVSPTWLVGLDDSMDYNISNDQHKIEDIEKLIASLNNEELELLEQFIIYQKNKRKIGEGYVSGR